jgi:hypothetical protein
MKTKYIFIGFVIGFLFTVIIWLLNEKIPISVKSKISDNKLKLFCKLDQLINYDNDTKGSCINGKFIYFKLSNKLFKK